MVMEDLPMNRSRLMRNGPMGTGPIFIRFTSSSPEPAADAALWLGLLPEDILDFNRGHKASGREKVLFAILLRQTAAVLFLLVAFLLLFGVQYTVWTNVRGKLLRSVAAQNS